MLPQAQRQREVGRRHQVAIGRRRRADRAHVQHRGELQRQRLIQRLRRQQAGDAVLRQVAPFLAPRLALPQPVHDQHLLPAFREGRDQVRADETGPAGDQMHAVRYPAALRGVWAARSRPVKQAADRARR
jgi:hypothetical protein